MIEPMLEGYYHIERRNYWSILPTATPYARNALFAGLYPLDIAEGYPAWWIGDANHEGSRNAHEADLLDALLRAAEEPGRRQLPLLQGVRRPRHRPPAPQPGQPGRHEAGGRRLQLPGHHGPRPQPEPHPQGAGAGRGGLPHPDALVVRALQPVGRDAQPGPPRLHGDPDHRPRLDALPARPADPRQPRHQQQRALQVRRQPGRGRGQGPAHEGPRGLPAAAGRAPSRTTPSPPRTTTWSTRPTSTSTSGCTGTASSTGASASRRCCAPSSC